MKISQIRNATVLLEFESNGKSIGLLVDPMLSKLGSMPAFKYFGGSVRRNPTVDLPSNSTELLQRVTHCLITHCQRGHVDHLDRAGTKFLRDGSIPVFCMPRDISFLAARRLTTQQLSGKQTQPFFHGQITPISCVHGAGLVGHLMEHGSGYFIDLPGEPTVYIAGDTILTDEVKLCLVQRKPKVAILPAGGAKFDLGGEIIMNAGEVVEACLLSPNVIFANHLEALDHCPTTRTELHLAAEKAGVMDRMLIPEDGDTAEFFI
jgi:L-ascorbate metabolism protein UlaG (beta-lactamase superfamily)